MKSKNQVPNYDKLVEATFTALKNLGGSGKNDEINEEATRLLNLPDEVLDITHSDSSSMSEINYRLAWARTLLKNYGAIENSARCVWSITPNFSNINTVDGDYVNKNYHKKRLPKNISEEQQMEENGVEVPEEIKPWRKKLHSILINMNPYSFEKLSQRLLRECGFEDVHVTKKSGDGGIDGTGRLKINGIFSFNIAFQCKRYQGTVGAPEIRDFRGSLTTDIEKGVFITTGTFSKAAIDEASNPGKQQIDLIDGEEFMTKLAEYEIGLREIKDYEIDENYFEKL